MAQHACTLKKKTRILVVGKRNLFLHALAAALDLEPDFAVIRQAGYVKGKLGDGNLSGPDVIIVDRALKLDDFNRLPKPSEHIRRLAQIIILCDPQGLETISEPTLLGEAPLRLPREIRLDSLKAFIRELDLGGQHFLPKSYDSYAENDNPLTTREIQALKYAEEGVSVLVIARKMNLSYGTVRNYLSGAIQKTQAANRFDAARRARLNGWI